MTALTSLLQMSALQILMSSVSASTSVGGVEMNLFNEWSSAGDHATCRVVASGNLLPGYACLESVEKSVNAGRWRRHGCGCNRAQTTGTGKTNDPRVIRR